MYYNLPNLQIFRKYIIFSLLAKCVLRPDEMTSKVRFGPRAVVGEPWYRLWREVVTAHTIVGVQHQRWTVVIWLCRHGRNLLSRNTVCWRPARGTHQRRTLATPPRAFHEKTSHVLSRCRQKICIRLWHVPRIYRKFAGEWKFVL